MGTAEALATTAKGEAEGAAVRARGLAEAEAIAKRAEALEKESDAVIGQQLAERLPEIVAAAAGAFRGVDHLTVLRMGEIMSQVIGQAGPALELARQTLGARNGSSPDRAPSRAVGWEGVFDSLAEKLQHTLTSVRQRGALTEEDISAAMREIRLALLEADVNFKVVKQFTATVKERCLGAEVQKQLNPGQQVVKIVNEELTALMGGQSAGLTFSPRPPTVVLMAGLQGSGKTTATAKLARWLREDRGSSVAVAACDVYRPAAVEQLVKVGGQAHATVYEQGTERNPVDIARWALDQAKRDGKDVLIIDTSGRLHIDEALMQELADIRKATRPHVVLLVVDAMTGQDAVNVAEQFAEVAQFDGVVLSKLDGDARGGAALSVKAVTGKPILFASTGEKLGDFERFHPDRMAQRILGMGDVLSFIEKAERSFEEDEAKALERKLRKNQFSLEDFLDQLRRIRKMGPLTSLLGMIPGLAGHQLSKMQVDEKEFDRIEAIILSMTPYERRHPELIKGSRRLRIAKGSGTTVQQVNQLVEAVRRDAQADAGAAAGQDARPRAAHAQPLRRPCTTSWTCATWCATSSPSGASPGTWSTTRSRRRRSPAPATWPRSGTRWSRRPATPRGATRSRRSGRPSWPPGRRRRRAARSRRVRWRSGSSGRGSAAARAARWASRWRSGPAPRSAATSRRPVTTRCATTCRPPGPRRPASRR